MGGAAPRAGRALTRRFGRVAAVDWSGQAAARPAGLAVAVAAGDDAPALVRPDGGWSRGAVLDWLAIEAAAGADLLVGLDLSFALPFLDRGGYFPGWPGSPPDAPALWRLVDDLCAGDPHLSASGFLAHAEARRHFRHRGEPPDLHPPGRGRLRVCEGALVARGLQPGSAFNLVGANQVGKSSLTGMRVLHRLRGVLPVWPFDPAPAAGPLVVEIYTAVAARAAGAARGRSKLRDAAALARALAALGVAAAGSPDRCDEHAADALVTAAWLRAAARDAALWRPPALTPEVARTEGWTFGVP